MDPSSEKHYNWSPYSYCKNNPVLRVDVDGKDDYTVNSAGRLFKTVVEGSTNDRLMSIRSGVEPITVNDKKILSGMYNMQDGKSGGLETYNSTSSLEDAAAVFKFGADNNWIYIMIREIKRLLSELRVEKIVCLLINRVN